MERHGPGGNSRRLLLASYSALLKVNGFGAAVPKTPVILSFASLRCMWSKSPCEQTTLADLPGATAEVPRMTFGHRKLAGWSVPGTFFSIF